jgi:hypothetical protein
MQKNLCGLGLVDLEKFGRALRLRWLCQEWKELDKPWVGSELPCKPEDHLLLNASTSITIGNGSRAKFWHHNWLDGMAPNTWHLTSSSWLGEKTKRCNKS